MVCSTDDAAYASAASKSRCDDSGMKRMLAEVGGLAADRTVGRKDDLFDLHLGLGELLLAVPLEQRPALIGRDRLIQLDLATLELLDDALQLLEGVFERQVGDILG